MDFIAQTTSSSAQPGLGLVILVCIVISARVWKRKGGDVWVGGLLGWFLGPIGVMVVLVATPKAAKAAKARASASVPAAPMPVRPDSIPVSTGTDAVATALDRFSES
jgi:hypothetical protein